MYVCWSWTYQQVYSQAYLYYHSEIMHVQSYDTEEVILCHGYFVARFSEPYITV